MKRAISIMVALALVGGVGAIVAGAMIDAEPFPTTCSEGYTSWEAFEGMDDGSAPALPLEQAIERQLREVIPVDVPESSVDSASVRSSGGSVEVLTVDVDGQPVVLRLKRHEGGYVDGGATWCAPRSD